MPQEGKGAFARRVGSWALLSAMLATPLQAGLLDLLEPEDPQQTTEDGESHSRTSLYDGPVPRPGPDILYAAPPRAPQLENAGAWKGAPILISGASAYRRGEFIYQDFIYDDHGADGVLPDPNDPRLTGSTSSGPGGTYTYPTDSIYGGNAADLVELRVKLHGDQTLFRITLNTLHDPDRVAFTLALGESALPVPFPHGANVRAPAQWFLSVAEARARLLDTDGRELAPAPSVQVDVERRQYEVRVPRAAWDPGEQAVRMALGVGLWDSAAGRYLLPEVSASETTPGGAGLLTHRAAFFNVAFRFDEPMPNPAEITGRTTPAYWRERLQAQALREGDISRFHAYVDFSKLRGNVSDDMIGQPQGVPQNGPMNRIVASRFESRQGVDFADTCGSADGCRGALRGQLQPYAIYVPKKAPPAEGHGLTLLLHSLGANYNQYSSSRNQAQLAERGRGHIVVTPAGRGPDGWYVDHAAADAFEVWADVARHYRLDPALTAISGYSMGGHGTFKFATRYPDLFARAFTVVGPPALGIWAPPAEPTGGESTNSYHQLESVRHVPFLMWAQVADELVPYTGTRAQAARFDSLGYRYRFDSFATGEHLTLALHDNYEPGAEFLGDARVDRDPPRITYVLNPAQDVPAAGLVADHAYWISGLRLRGDGAGGRGLVDVRSHGFGIADPGPGPTKLGAGLLSGNLGLQAYESQFKSWAAPGSLPAADALDIRARNVSSLTVHPDRARVSCHAALDVDTDGPLTVRLAGCNREESFAGGR